MEIPFIKYGNDDVIFETNKNLIFVNGIEIILFRYFLYFKNNQVEKLICFYQDDNTKYSTINKHLKLLYKNPPELYLDNNCQINQLFVHATHKKKITQQDINILKNYLKSFSNFITDLRLNIDETCPFALSFSFRYDKEKIELDNYHYYLNLKAKMGDLV